MLRDNIIMSLKIVNVNRPGVKSPGQRETAIGSKHISSVKQASLLQMLPLILLACGPKSLNMFDWNCVQYWRRDTMASLTRSLYKK